MNRPRCQIVNEVQGLLADLSRHRICGAIIRCPQAELFFPIAIGFKRSAKVTGRRVSLLAALTGKKKRAEGIGFRARDSRPLQCCATSSKCDAMHGVRPDAAARPRANIKGLAPSSAMHNSVDVSTS